MTRLRSRLLRRLEHALDRARRDHRARLVGGALLCEHALRAREHQGRADGDRAALFLALLIGERDRGLEAGPHRDALERNERIREDRGEWPGLRRVTGE